MLLTHTNYHPELQRTLTTTSILPVAISVMTTTFLQELLFRKLVCSWLAPYSIVTALVSTSLFFLFHMPTNLAHLFLYIGMGLALSMVYQKRENLSATISLHILWNIFTLGATILVRALNKYTAKSPARIGATTGTQAYHHLESPLCSPRTDVGKRW